MKQTIQFTKMHGLGNDYIYVNCLDKPVRHPSEVSKIVSNRHTGVGGDGLVLILPSDIGDYQMRMFNADGSEAEMCGNAVRCIAKYLYERGITTSERISLETRGGMMELELSVCNNIVESVRADMGEPVFEGLKIPVDIDKKQVVAEPISVNGCELTMTCVSMGNPHAVVFVDEITDELVCGIGPQIEISPLFPNKVNVEFIKVLNSSEVQMRVWERGSGETMACGTGAAAVCVAGVLNGFTERVVTVHLLGGDLEIEWASNNHVYKTGPAEFVFDSSIQIELAA